MSIKGKTARLLNNNGDIVGTGFISQEDTFDISNNNNLVFRYIRFDKKAFNITDSNNQFVGVLRETSLNRYNQIINNSVAGQVIIS